MSASVVMTQMIIFFVLILTGYLLTKKKIVDMSGSRQLSAIVSNICNPALLLASAFNEDNKATNEDVLLVAGIALVIYLIWFVVGLVIGPLLRAPKEERDYYRLMVMFANTGFIGIPLVTALIGPSCVIYVAVFNLFFNAFIYTYGNFLIARQSGEKGSVNWKVFVNPGTISSILTVIIFWFKVPVPTVAVQCIQHMGNATTFLALFTVGISLAQVPFKKIFGEVRLYPFIAIRFVLLPILIGQVVKLFVTDADMLAVIVIMCAVPVANMPLMLARGKGLEAEVLSKGILLTTIMSIITIPIITLFVGA